MKRPKKAILNKIVTPTTKVAYEFQCPHCHVFFTTHGYLNENILMIRCDSCKGIIDFRPKEKRNER